VKKSLLTAAALLAATPALAANHDNAGDAGHGLALILIIIGINFLPVIIANVRKHNARGAILAVLLLLDFLFVPTATLGLLALLTFPVIAACWFACLIWSLNGNTEAADQRRADMIASAMRSESEAMRREQAIARIGFDAVDEAMQ
jgi:hypothetical protein